MATSPKVPFIDIKISLISTDARLFLLSTILLTYFILVISTKPFFIFSAPKYLIPLFSNTTLPCSPSVTFAKSPSCLCEYL
jgi:hypothetical protein